MTHKANARDKLLEKIEMSKSNGAEFISYAGRDNAIRVDDALGYIRQLPEDLGSVAEEVARWYECDEAGNRIIRAREIYIGLTRHVSGVIVWNGSADVYCGNWSETRGLPRSFGQPDLTGEGKKLVAVCIGQQQLDDDTRELAFEAALAKGDKTPSISEVFRVNDVATVITFDGWP